MHDEQYIPDDTWQIRAMIAAVAAIWIGGIVAAVASLT
jgi:hypothetical protein